MHFVIHAKIIANVERDFKDGLREREREGVSERERERERDCRERHEIEIGERGRRDMETELGRHHHRISPLYPNL